ncbi:Glutaminyl-tRNA synthetase [Sorochytrium milnesiophthora]
MTDNALLKSMFFEGEISKLHKPGENPQTDPRLMGEHLKFTEGRVLTRFPPEPNGFLHIGHAKAININFGYARVHNGNCYLRYDDTNPDAEEKRFFDTILETVQWLGYSPWKVTYSSDYFQRLFDLAVELVRRDKAYVCHCTGEEIYEQRGGDKKGPRTECVHRNRSIEESLAEFDKMKQGRYQEGQAILRMKMDMQSGNPQFWDLAAYRIKFTPHYRTHDQWCIYPTYDYTHCLADDHQVLTNRGFLSRSEVEVALADGALLTFATYDPTARSMHYAAATAFINKPAAKRDMVEFVSPATERAWKAGPYGGGSDGERSNHVSLLVTEGHRMLVAQGNPNNITDQVYNFVDAETLLSTGNSGRGRHADAPLLKLPSAAVAGAVPEQGDPELFARLGLTTDDHKDAFVELYGYWLGDGSMMFRNVAPKHVGGYNAVSFAPRTDVDKHYLADLFARLPLKNGDDWRSWVTPDNRTEFIIIAASWFDAFLEEYGAKYGHDGHPTAAPPVAVSGPEAASASAAALMPAPTEPIKTKSAKLFWWWVLRRLSAARLRLLIRGLRFADGNQSTQGDDVDAADGAPCIHTSSVVFRDEVLIACLHAGYTAFFAPVHVKGEVNAFGTATVDGWCVSYSENDRVRYPTLQRARDVKKVQYDGPVWCVNVPPYNTIVVRRAATVVLEDDNGKSQTVVSKASRPMIIGNCLVDSFENITHSFCTLEFRQSRESYYWLVDALDQYKPVQWESGRLNITNSIMSKRKLTELVRLGHVKAWDDPRLFTLVALRRRGCPPEAINNFVCEVGITFSNTTTELARLENQVRKHLNDHAPRLMAILDPIKVVLENLPEDHLEFFDVPNNPRDEASGSHQVPFTRVVYIDRDDFRESDEKGYFRLAPGKSVGLQRVPFPITYVSHETDQATGAVTEIVCKYDNNDAEFKKPKAYIHWIADAPQQGSPVRIEARLYETLFMHSNPSDKAAVPGGYLTDINPNSLTVKQGLVEVGLIDWIRKGLQAQRDASPDFEYSSTKDNASKPHREATNMQMKAVDALKFQFVRTGYFCVDPDSDLSGDDPSNWNVVVNKTVALNEDVGKDAAAGAGGAKAAGGKDDRSRGSKEGAADRAAEREAKKAAKEAKKDAKKAAKEAKKAQDGTAEQSTVDGPSDAQ